MFKFLFKRFMSLIPVMFIISVMLFGLFKSMPGDPVKLMIPAGIKSEVQRQMIYDQKVQQLGYN